MNVGAVALSAAGFVAVMGSLGLYLRTIPGGTVPVSVGGLVTKLWIGVGLSAAAIAWSVYSTGGAGVAVLAPAAFAIMMGGFFLWVVSQRHTPVGDLKVSVGDPLLSFSATTSDGEPFRSDALKGKRTLLKFFRGGW